MSAINLKRRPRRSALGMAIVGALGVYAMANSLSIYAQSTTGAIYGTAPTNAGETVLIQGSSGLTREVAVNADGRFSVTSLPLGTYKVSLRQNGATVDTRSDISLTVGAGTQVSFTAKTLSTVTVTGTTLPSIDVTQMDSRTVVTADQLAKLPIQRSAEAIALLAPGVNSGSGYFTGPTGQTLVSFGGSTIAENAYYLNGFNTSDPLHNFGGLTLPYGAIDQEQVMTGGYGAAYGRSDGGVLNMVGKRGTNEWHFGFQEVWTPEALQSSPANWYYPSGPKYLSNANGGSQGQIYDYRHNDRSWERTESAYVGGPLIKDKLFFFAAVEADHVDGGAPPSNNRATPSSNTAPVGSDTTTTTHTSNPKWYAKLDWNITDSNILELTGASNKSNYSGNIYSYDYPAGANKGVRGDFLEPDIHTKNGADMWVAKYTGYITDDLTVEAMYGKMKQTNYSQLGAGGTDANVVDAYNQNPGLLPPGSSGITGPQAIQTYGSPNAHDETSNLRFDVNYKIGDHSITAGIDNLNITAIDNGTLDTGDGYYWVYGQGSPNLPISTLPGETVGAPGGQGYYVSKEIYSNFASRVHVKQRAQYIEDKWQVSDRVLLSLGVRNDQFTNYNPSSVPYLRLTKPQWAPRLGGTWDVYGDASFKVYANAGRYYIDEPANVAVRGAASSIYTDQYFTYTGVDPASGAPTGLTQIPQGHYPGVSANNEFGGIPDPKTVASKTAKAEYQDEYIAGFDKNLDFAGSHWTYGAKGIYRVLRNDLDDTCDDNTIASEASAQGLDPVAALGTTGCYILNPGRDAKINVSNGAGGYSVLDIPWSTWGMPKLLRKYVALQTYFEHPFDGTWYGRIDYVWSHSYGNTEGSVRSDIGQTDVATTEDWDNAGVMTYANGDQANDRRHQIKLIGYYQITPEWLVGGNVQILSGTPISCLGYFGAGQTNPYGYGAAYHFCGPNGTPAPGGRNGRTPWQELISLNVEYRPEWADKKLAFGAMIYNLLDQQRITQYYPISESGPGQLNSTWMVPISAEQPRYFRFTVSYDF